MAKDSLNSSKTSLGNKATTQSSTTQIILPLSPYAVNVDTEKTS